MERTISISMGKGSLPHNNRIFVAKNVDRERIADNVIYKREDIRQVYHTLFDEALEEYNHRQKRKDRRIPDYYEKIRQSRQEKLFYEMIVQIGNRDDMGTDYREMASLSKEILSEYMEGFQERNPNLYVFNAVLHMDEATPHLHIDYVPYITDSKRGLRVRNSLKGALAAQGFIGEGKQNSEWAKWAEHEKEVLAEIMEWHEIQWKQLGTHEEHLTVLDFKKKMRQQEVRELDDLLDEQREFLEQQALWMDKGRSEIAAQQKEIKQNATMIEEQNQEHREQSARLDEIRKEISRKEQEYEDISDRITDKEEILETVTDELEGMKAEQSRAKAVCEMYEEESRKQQEQLEELEEERSVLISERESLVEGNKSILEERSKIWEETNLLVAERDLEERAMLDASLRQKSYQYDVAMLDYPEWSLREPGALTSAKNYFREVAFPLVEKLKDRIKSLLAQVKLLEGKVKELLDYKQWAEKKIKTQAKEAIEREKQFQDLLEAIEELDLLRIAMAPDELYELFITALDIYEQEHGIRRDKDSKSQVDYGRRAI